MLGLSRSNLVRSGLFDQVRSGLFWFGLVWFGLVWSGPVTNLGPIRSFLVRSGFGLVITYKLIDLYDYLYGFDLIWFGLIWIGLVWFGLVGLIWIGLDWIGLKESSMNLNFGRTDLVWFGLD